MRRLLLALGLPLLLTACGKESSSGGSSSSGGGSGSSRKTIPGGSAHDYKGAAFDLPGAWKKNVTEQGVALIPDGANAQGMLEELYVLMNDPQLTSLDGEAFDNAIRKLLEQLQVNPAKSGDERRKVGEFDGRIVLYKGDAEGKAYEVRIHAFKPGSSVSALVVFGFSDKLANRKSDLDAILASFGKTETKAATGGGGGVRGELAGTWVRLTDFRGNEGSYRNSDVLTLNGDGTYTNKWETDSSNPFGATGAQGGDSGHWTATDTTLTFNSGSGGSSTVGLEKRNHPKNTNDPMIVLDGKAYVTMYRKDPW